jgi:hypothetical protein
VILNFIKGGLMKPRDAIVAQAQRIQRSRVHKSRFLHQTDVVVVQLEIKSMKERLSIFDFRAVVLNRLSSADA